MERTASDTSINKASLQDEPRQDPVPWWSRRRYSGTLLFNLACFLLPALYGTLSKMWIASIDDGNLVATSDTYTYVGIIVEVFNEALPRAVWSTVADYSTRSLAERLALTRTLIIVQTILGFLLSLAFIGAAESFVANFVPGPVRDVSVQYVRVLSFGSCLGSTVETAVALGTRALDQPDVPLLISICKVSLQIVLELIFISTVHVRGVKPTIIKQAVISLVCSLVSAGAGLAYFLAIARRLTRSLENPSLAKPSLRSLITLAKPGSFTFLESAVRNAIYLYLVHNVVSMGQDYATAWGVFSIASPALISVAVALTVEVPLCLGLSFGGARPFARYLSASDEVARITQHMWRTIDWCYIMYALSTQLATLLLATKPSWYLGQSLVSNLLYCLPWAIALGEVSINPDNAWTYHAFVFGGSLVVTFVIILVVDAVWAWRVASGRIVRG
ncbi:hypothetical protein JCM10213_001822 [Rhodosporidiobolus nylandii]